MLTAECIWDVKARLGEGPIWWGGRLWFTDIKGGRLLRLDPATGARDSFEVAGEPGFIVPADDGTMIVGMGQALHRFVEGQDLTPLVRLETAPSVRLNDATVDAFGRLWFGSMDNLQKEALGAFHSFERGRVRTLTEATTCCITNGPAVDSDGRLLYAVDTLAGQIWRYRIADDGTLTDQTLFLTIDRADGVPDGVVCDAEGCLWLALWGGGGVRRYDPAGALMRDVRLPCAQVTKVAFGGPDLRTGYITTAATGLDASQQAAQPLAGGLFAFEADAPGLAANAVRLTP